MLVTRRCGESTAITLENTLISLGRKKRANRDADLSVKFMTLQTAQSREPEQTLVHNLSSKHLTVAQTKVLQRGSGFNTTDTDPVTFIASFESVLRQTGATDEAKDLLRHQISSLLMSHRKTHSLLRDEQKALRELKADTEIAILPADKGRSTVILDKVDYRNKALMLLNDRESYMVSDAASLKSLLAKVNKILSRLKKEKVITVKEWYMAKPTETPMARFYGLPKVHKPDVPLRPIVSLRGTPTYGLANWLFQKLRFLTVGSQTTVHSAEQFLDKIRAVTIEPNERMVSFDVVSLFTSIPQALAVETLSDLLRQNYDEGDGQPTAQDLIELMGHCLKTFFTFEGITYEQIKGTPMGSPISGLIAEAVLQKLEKRLFGEYKPKFCARYVDDTFVIIDQDKITYYEELLNSIIPDLQFTMEEEVESKLSFLDVLVYRQPDGKLATSVYRKPTNTLQMLSYNSNHPLQHKRSCVRTLYRRVETHCSTPAAKLDEIKLLQELFRANGYPRTFVERSRKQPRKRSEEPSQPKSWRSIPYMKGVSEAVARSLAPLGIGVAHRPDSTIRRQVMRPKDPIPKQEMSAIVYRLQCSCGMCNYVGETGRRLQTRMHEHKLAVRRLDPKSEVATHAAQMGHVFDFDAVEIVGRGDDHTARQVQEAWMSTDCSVNRHINLPPPYLVLRTFLTGDSHGAGQSGPPIIAAADEDEQDSGHGNMRVGCSHTGGIGGPGIKQGAT
ncbi:hypothetical protein SprV_0702430800 [Sparganum proliferum]